MYNLPAKVAFTCHLDDAESLLYWLTKYVRGEYRPLPTEPSPADAEAMKKVFYLLHDASMAIQEVARVAE